MKKFVCLLLGWALLGLFSQNVLSQPEVTPLLKDKLEEKQDMIPLNIRMDAQYEQKLFRDGTRHFECKKTRRRWVMTELKEFRDNHQAGILSYLKDMKKQGKVKDIRSLWMVNFIHCKAAPSVIEQLKLRKDIARLDYDEVRYFPPAGLDFDIDRSLEVMKAGPEKKEVAWHVSRINATEVWDDGYFGQNVVVAVIDSGVDYLAEDLSGNMWEHPDFPNHGYNFVDDNDDPMDYDPLSEFGHGTAVAGIVAGQGHNGLITGVAPEARIMAVKVLSPQGGTEATVMQGIEFAVAQGADIMNISLGAPQHTNPDRVAMRTIMDNAKSAGVIASVSSGNHGSSIVIEPPYEVGTPGDIPPPWLHPDQTLIGGTSAVVSVGATAENDSIACFSSRGPVIWQEEEPYNDYPYDPEMGLIRPDIVAPGDEMYSIITNWAHGDYIQVSGTSFSAPAVAGTMALLLSKNPMLTPEEMAMLLEKNAEEIGGSKNNEYGSGLLNALAATEATTYPGISLVSFEIDDSEGNNDGQINPGERIKLDLTLENTTSEYFENAEIILKTTSSFISLIDSVAGVGDFSPGQNKHMEGVFTFEVAENIHGGYTIELLLLKPTVEDLEESHWETAINKNAVAPHLIFTDIEVDDSENEHPDGRLSPGKESFLRVKLENTGEMVAEKSIVIIQPDEPYVKVTGKDEVSAGTVEAGQSKDLLFPVKVHEDVAKGAEASFSLSINSGAYAIEKFFRSKIGMMENWDNGSFENFNWETQGDAPWILDESKVYDGKYSARSGEIDHDQESELYLEVDVMREDSISFYRKVSSEPYDYLDFYINDNRKKRWSGEKSWEKFVFPVEKGNQVFRWVYKKDFMVSEGEDCGWIDRIELPSPATTWAFAGFDKKTDGSSPVSLNGFASRFDEVLWSTEGSGSFDNPLSLQTIYSPSEQDLINGMLRLTITAFHGQEEVSHSMKLLFEEGLSTEEQISGKKEVIVYPNPANEKVIISTFLPQESGISIRLFNASGQKVNTVFEGKADGRFRKEVGLKGLTPGLYLVKVKSGHMTHTRKLIVK